MHRFVPIYLSDNISFKLLLNSNVKIEVVVKVSTLHKQGNNIKVTVL